MLLLHRFFCRLGTNIVDYAKFIVIFIVFD